MIIIEIANSLPYEEKEGLAVKQISDFSVPLDDIVAKDFCFCSIECEYFEKVFVSEDGDERKNDKSSFLFSKQKNSDTIEYKLIKNNIEIADLNNDLYGIFYDGVGDNSLYIGYLLEWKKVYDSFGNGTYQIRTNLDILGNIQQIDSRKFFVTLFSESNADGTVKIESYNTGSVLNSNFDFTDLIEGGWYQSFRIKGFFGKKTPVLEQDNYLDSNYNITQIQPKLIKEYQLNTKYLPAEVANKIFFDNILDNRIFISDYNITNYEVYNQIDVVPEDLEEVIYQDKKTGVRHLWRFKERLENNVKSNF